MKCPSCGADINGTKFCEYCGTQITSEMQKEQEQINKQGCPKCGSTNITFKRENQGEIRGKNAKKVIHKTVGYCKDCGYTWTPDSSATDTKKRKTWLWVLGWIFIFPLPLTLILVKKKDMNNILKYSIIAVAWIVYLIIGFSGGDSKKPVNSTPNTATNSISAENNGTSDYNAQTVINITNGETGEYGKVRKINIGTEEEQEIIEYHIPAGTYKIINNDSVSTVQISIYSDGWVKNDDGWEEPVKTIGTPLVLSPKKEDSLTIEEGSYVKLSDGNEKLVFTKID